ncbi:uncharacterized protein EV422DRAFT_519716, partial [Fimicolochytrium jonesii]|uniref:uncharacterized protein n=1 Tax=Fimicolochytrium jonesii TaxID=1396493 RepID=UPI0022FF0ACA
MARILNNSDDELQFVFSARHGLFPRWEKTCVKKDMQLGFDGVTHVFTYSSTRKDVVTRIFDATGSQLFTLLHTNGFWKDLRETDSFPEIDCFQIQIRILHNYIVPFYALSDPPTGVDRSCMEIIWRHLAEQKATIMSLSCFQLPDFLPSPDDLLRLTETLHDVTPIVQAMDIVAPKSREVAMLRANKNKVEEKIDAWMPLVKLFNTLGEDLTASERADRLRLLVDHFDTHNEWNVLELATENPVSASVAVDVEAPPYDAEPAQHD